MRRAIFALLIAIVAAFAVAGCGGGSDSTQASNASYKKAYAPLSVEIRGLGIVAGNALRAANGQPAASVSATFNQLGKQADHLADQLDKMDTPSDDSVRHQHLALIAGLRTQADDLRGVASAVRAGNREKTTVAVKSLVRDAPQVSGAQAALVKELKTNKGG